MGKRRIIPKLEQMEKKLDSTPEGESPKVYFVDIALAFSDDIRDLNKQYDRIVAKLTILLGKRHYQETTNAKS